MSLFSTLDFWSARCGIDETFGFDSLAVADLDESGHDKIIVGSYSGLLRIYEVWCNDSERTSFKPSHLLLESQLSSGITQIVVGKLVSGSKAIHIGVVHSRSIAVYNLSLTPGSTEHGNQFELKMIYEHPLQHMNYQVIIGPFGGVQKRDFLCAAAVDGTLSFFEQETFVFETQLPMFLLPSPLVYVSATDVFVTLSADWCIEGYRYQDLVNTVRKKVTANWSINLGETLLGLKSTMSQIPWATYMVALSEHNITCFNEHGLVKFTKRLQYTPLCFHIYINEYDGNLMVLTVSDCGTLFIYEKCTLHWSAKLQITPVCVSRANFNISGSLVLLSSEGELVCCYLGTKPTLFVAPPLENSVTSFKNVSKQLENLQENIRTFKNNNGESLSLAEYEQELSAALKILPFDKSLNQCHVAIELIPSRPLSNVLITFETAALFCVHPSSYTLSTLCEKTILNAVLEITNCKEIVATKLEISVVICYMGTSVPRLIRRRATTSARFVLLPATVTEEECSFKVNLRTNKPPALLATIFQEFRDEKWSENGCNDETVGFCLRYNTDKKCIVSLSKSKYGYNFASNSVPMLQLILSQVTSRCRTLKSASEKHSDSLAFDCEYVPKDELVKAVADHVAVRNKLQNLQSLLEKLSAQFRLIQRRLLIKLKDKIISNISPLRLLYQNTYEKLIETIHFIEEEQDALLACSCELQSTIDMTFDLILMNNTVSTEKVTQLRNAMTLTTLSTDTQGWEERTLTNITYLLRTTLASSSRDQHRVLPMADQITADSAPLLNVIFIAIDRVVGTAPKADQMRAVSPILEDDEFEENRTAERKFRFIKHEKLLRKRQSQVAASESQNDFE